MSDELAETLDFEQDDFFFEEETEAQAYERMDPAEQEADRLYAAKLEAEADAEQSLRGVARRALEPVSAGLAVKETAMTQSQAEKLGYRIERYPCLPEQGLKGRRWLWRLEDQSTGRTINAGYQSRRKLLAWLEEETRARFDP